MNVRLDTPLGHPFLSTPKGHFIDGRMSAPEGASELFETFNPATGKVLARLAEGTASDVDRAVAAARTAFEGEWSRWSPLQRQQLLIRIHDVMEANFEELALLETLDMGAPLSRTRSLKPAILQTILYFSSQTMNVGGQTLPNSLRPGITTMVLKAPIGVVGGIIPWNGPLISQWWILGPALATGCTAVIKPAEDASLTVLRTAELLAEAGVPPGVVNIVTGHGATTGAAVAAHPGIDRIAFTGSTETGKRIVEASAVNMKRLQLELGGKSPDIVFADADLDAAVPGAAMAVFNNSGQICFAGTRLFVERKIQDEFVARIADFGKTLRVGNGLDADVQLGPLISARQLDRVLGYMEIAGQEGAELVSGGARIGGALAEGYFVEPTIFANVSNDMRIAQEEIFGPVISVIPFDEPEEVLAMANEIDYGLGGAVWTRDLGKAMKMVHGIRTGTLWVNCYGLIDPGVGFGGVKMSGYGQKGGPSHVDAYLYQKCVYLNAG